MKSVRAALKRPEAPYSAHGSCPRRRMQREGVFREMKLRRFYEKPSERAAREHNEAIRRRRKLARKKAQREGLLPDPRAKKKLLEKKQDPRRPGQALGNRN